MKRINRKQIKLTAKYNKPHDGTRRLLTSTPGAIIGLILFGTILQFSCGINSSSTYATSSTLSLTLSSDTVSLNISPANANGTFSTSPASTISAWTDNATGYTLKISSSNVVNDANKYLVNTVDSNEHLTSIDSIKSSSGFNAGEWGYIPSQYYNSSTGETVNNTGNNPNYLPAPGSNGDILALTTTANAGTASTNADTYTIALGAKVDYTVKTGTYRNSTFVVQLVSNAIPYTITYVDNVVGSMPVDVISTADGNTVTVSSNTPTRSGYTFIGWCTVAPTLNTNGTDTCSGTTVNPNGTITVDRTGGSNNFTLYAMWSGNYTIDAMVAANKTLQDFNYMSTEEKGKIALSMDPTRSYTLKDSRDNQDYTIARLADGNIWMTKNLNLPGGTTLTCDKTDCDEGYVLPSNQGWQSTAGQLPTSSTVGFSTDNYAYVYNSGNTSDCGASGQNTPCFSYYSWDAATLGSGRNISAENTDAPYSICPKGWRLPTSGQHDGSSTAVPTSWRRGDLYRLLTAYGANLETAYGQNTNIFYNNAGPGTVANFLLSGRVDDGALGGEGVYGLYWTSTSINSAYSRNSDFRTGYINSASNNRRRIGFGVRCLLR